jgi:hypothetical protein
MPCSERSAEGTASLAALRAAVALALLSAAGSVGAHKASDSYLQITAAPAQLDVRWDIALRDLDVALELDSDADGKLTWGEVRTAWPRIEGYALPRLAIDGCPLSSVGHALERRSDGAYAVLALRSPCTLAAAAPRISYGLFAEVDPTHRGILKVQRAGKDVVLSVLEPSAAMSREAAPATGAGGAGRPVGSIAASSVDERPHATTRQGRWDFLVEGIRHILTGYDHVLFLLCLLLPSVMRRAPPGWQPVERLGQAVWPVVGIVTAFTVAHSITLAIAVRGLLTPSPKFVEPAIALSIAYVGIENFFVKDASKRWRITFPFGLIHGFGFAGALQEINLPRAQVPVALVTFNLGEAGFKVESVATGPWRVGA